MMKIPRCEPLRAGVAAAAIAAAMLLPAGARSQASDRDIELLRLMSTPIGALSPISLPMPASRNNSYWIGRFQTGQRRSPGGTNLAAAAAGLDFQYRGGSILGVTGGYQQRECRFEGAGCGGHALFGARAQINLVTGGSTMAGLLRDNSTTSAFGTEVGFGYAPNVTEGVNACTVDIGIPLFRRETAAAPAFRYVRYAGNGVGHELRVRRTTVKEELFHRFRNRPAAGGQSLTRHIPRHAESLSRRRRLTVGAQHFLRPVALRRSHEACGPGRCRGDSDHDSDQRLTNRPIRRKMDAPTGTANK